jgi:hypothetical protein
MHLLTSLHIVLLFLLGSNSSPRMVYIFYLLVKEVPTEESKLHLEEQSISNLELILNPDSEWCFRCNIYFFQASVAWNSKARRYVTLSSTEAEYLASVLSKYYGKLSNN